MALKAYSICMTSLCGFIEFMRANMEDGGSDNTSSPVAKVR